MRRKLVIAKLDLDKVTGIYTALQGFKENSVQPFFAYRDSLPHVLLDANERGSIAVLELVDSFRN